MSTSAYWQDPFDRCAESASSDFPGRGFRSHLYSQEKGESWITTCRDFDEEERRCSCAV